MSQRRKKAVTRPAGALALQDQTVVPVVVAAKMVYVEGGLPFTHKYLKTINLGAAARKKYMKGKLISI